MAMAMTVVVMVAMAAVVITVARPVDHWRGRRRVVHRRGRRVHHTGRRCVIHRGGRHVGWVTIGRTNDDTWHADTDAPSHIATGMRNRCTAQSSQSHAHGSGHGEQRTGTCHESLLAKGKSVGPRRLGATPTPRITRDMPERMSENGFTLVSGRTQPPA